MLHLLIVIAMLYCAYMVMNSRSLLNATIWLAFTSALTAVLIYLLGAPEVAVIELSVGAGLVTVLFVFAFSIVGEATVDEKTLIPRPLVWVLILAAAFVLGWFIFPLPELKTSLLQVPFGRMLWERRGLDVIAQVVLIFSGVMGLIGLLSDTRPPASIPALQQLAGQSETHGDNRQPVAETDPTPETGIAPEEAQA
jgi:uncharacterized MnhB-related membrane protein